MKKLLTMTSMSMLLLISACSNEDDEELKIEEESSITDSEGQENQEEVENEDETTNQDNEEDSEQNDESESDHLQIGESATINDVTVTINDAHLTDERNENNLIDVSGVLILEVTYENNSSETFPTGRDIVVESNGELMRSYELEGLLLEDIAPGETVSGRMAYGLVDEPETLTATYQPLLNESDEEAVFELDISDEQ